MADVVCVKCGHVGDSRTVTKGSLLIELILWLCFLIPGLIYSIWRHTSRYQACPLCGNAELLPANAPLAQKFIRENAPRSQAGSIEPPRPPSKTAHSAGKALGKLVGKVLK